MAQRAISILLVLALSAVGCATDCEDCENCDGCGDDDACEDPTPPEDPEDETDYQSPEGWGNFDVDDGVYLLLSLESDDVLEYLAPFSFIVGDADWIGMGESAPASGGFYLAKYQLMKFLIATAGVRAVAFDSPWYEAGAITDFSATCEDQDPAEDDVIAGLRPQLHEEAVASAMDWICWWNLAFYSDQVRAFGFGVEQPWHDRDLLEAFLEDAVGGDVADLVAGIATCNGVEADDLADYEASADYQQRLSGLDDADHAPCVSGLADLRTYLDDNEAALVAATSPDELAWARISLTGLEAWEESAAQYALDAAASQAALDAGSAYAVREIHRLVQPDSKVVLWSDNRRMAEAFSDTTPEGDGPQGWLSVGQHLAQEVDYAAVGFVGFDVRTDWPGIEDPPLPTHMESLGWMLHHYELPYLAVDLSPNDGESFLEDGQEYIVTDSWMVPADQYEGLFYLGMSDAPLWLQ